MEFSPRWLVLLVILSLISLFFFPSTSYAGTSWLKFNKKNSLLNTYTRAYAVEGDRLWVGTYGDGVVVYNGMSEKNYCIKNTGSKSGTYDGMISDLVTCLTIDEKAGRVWIGTNQGLCSCNLLGQNWKQFSMKDGLPNDVIRDVAIDGSGNVWVATPSGMAKHDGETWKVFNSDSGLEDQNIEAITIEGDNLWIASVGGTVSRFNGSVWKTLLRN